MSEFSPQTPAPASESRQSKAPGKRECLPKDSAVPGFAILGCFTVGICGLLAAFFCHPLHNPAWPLLVSGLMFGYLVHFSFRT